MKLPLGGRNPGTNRRVREGTSERWLVGFFLANLGGNIPIFSWENTRLIQISFLWPLHISRYHRNQLFAAMVVWLDGEKNWFSIRFLARKWDPAGMSSYRILETICMYETFTQTAIHKQITVGWRQGVRGQRGHQQPERCSAHCQWRSLGLGGII